MDNKGFTRRQFLKASAAGLSFMYLPGVGRIKARPFGTTATEDTFGRLCYNENPLGPSPLALGAMQQAAAEGNRYPDWFSSTLEANIALQHGVSSNMICAGAGATEMIRLVADAFLYAGGELVTANPTYSQMASEAAANGASIVYVPVDENYMIDLSAIRDAITGNTKLVSLVNPNNPQATIFSKTAMQSFMDSLPSGIVVVVDEAYHHYVHSSDYESCIRYVTEGYPLVVIRTFSKAYGLAGVRIGYTVASAGYTSMIQSSQNIGMVSRLAQAAAIAALADTQHLNNTIALNEQAKEILIEGFRALRLGYIPSETNFMMFDTGTSASTVAASLANAGFLVRVGWGMPQHIRVSTGTIDEMQQFIVALGEILGQTPGGGDSTIFGLSRVYPNPFSQQCTIRISIWGGERVRLVIYDASGRKVQALVNGVLQSGTHDIIWDGKDVHGRSVPSGVYVIHLMQGEFAESRRVTLVR
ncbi:MAG: aminotransferase class I/II-fold pyridoxal phosphate-dependent enzyme [candidate division WOR-3 bacterium]|nr:MAG: aminotransferase class I/II-fold pyridoxal phosphate-dependent enzyme [candidate division WOR-3 bacterium]